MAKSFKKPKDKDDSVLLELIDDITKEYIEGIEARIVDATLQQDGTYDISITIKMTKPDRLHVVVVSGEE